MADTEPSDGAQTTLAEMAAGGVPLTLERALTLVQASALALDRHHSRRAVHGVITPAAFAVHEDDRVTIVPPADDDLTTIDAAAYWSPQRQAGEPARLSDDLYALGVIATQLLRAAGTFAAAHDEPGNGLSLDAEMLLRPLTAWAPSGRPASGAELVRVVHRAVPLPVATLPSGAGDMLGPARPHVEPPWAAARRVAQARRAHRLAQATPPQPTRQPRAAQVRAPLGRGHYPDMPLPTVWVAAIVVVLCGVYLFPLYYMLFPSG